MVNNQWEEENIIIIINVYIFIILNNSLNIDATMKMSKPNTVFNASYSCYASLAMNQSLSSIILFIVYTYHFEYVMVNFNTVKIYPGPRVMQHWSAHKKRGIYTVSHDIHLILIVTYKTKHIFEKLG